MLQYYVGKTFSLFPAQNQMGIKLIFHDDERRAWSSTILAFQTAYELYFTWNQSSLYYQIDRPILYRGTIECYSQRKNSHNYSSAKVFIFVIIHWWWTRSSHQSVYVCTCFGGGSVPVESVYVRESSISSQSQLHHLQHLHLLEQLL